ncbi:MAG: hypothetical protein RLP44_18695 [Aggregatilineales bacterium]
MLDASRWKSFLLNLLSPISDIPPTNPVFLAEMRRVHDFERNQRRTRQMCYLVFLAGMLMWSVFTLMMLINPQTATGIYDDFYNLLWLALFGSLADKLVVDFGVINTGLTAISDDIRTGRWELVSLSSLSTRHYVLGKFAAQQHLAWRLVALSMTFRLTIMVVGALHIFIMPFFLPARIYDTSTPLVYFVRRMTENPPESLIIYAIYSLSALGAAAMYCVEPRWRMSALTGSTLAVSATGQDITLSFLRGLLIIVRVWVSQIIFAITGIMMLLLIVWLTALFYTLTQSNLLVSLGIPLYVFLLGSFIRAVYNGLYERSIARAYQTLVKRGGTP